MDKISGTQIGKIIYFDKETISNILQKRNKGLLSNQQDSHTSKSLETSASTMLDASVSFSVPLLSRLKFLFTSSLLAKYVRESDVRTTITSTELSQFASVKPDLISFSHVKLSDVPNSATCFRVAGTYMTVLKGQLDFDVNSFKAALESYDGYDLYKVDDDTYVRFNNSAFLSNYKRNEILLTEMELYCIPVGTFEESAFDFQKTIESFAEILSAEETPTTLAEAFPLMQAESFGSSTNTALAEKPKTIRLFDVLYAQTSKEAAHENL